jgi:hypothetical protein
MMAHARNPIYGGGRDPKDQGSRPALAKVSKTPNSQTSQVSHMGGKRIAVVSGRAKTLDPI